MNKKGTIPTYLYLQTVPEWAKWYAFDQDGSLFIYAEKPYYVDALGYWLCDIGSRKQLVGQAAIDVSEVWDELIFEIKPTNNF